MRDANPTGWLSGSGRASDLSIVDVRFDSLPGRCSVKTLGKFLTPMCSVVLYNIIYGCMLCA